MCRLARQEYGRRASVRLDGLSIVRGEQRQRAPVRQRGRRVGSLLAREPLPATEGEALRFQNAGQTDCNLISYYDFRAALLCSYCTDQMFIVSCIAHLDHPLDFSF